MIQILKTKKYIHTQFICTNAKVFIEGDGPVYFKVRDVILGRLERGQDAAV